jgi:hypothetical protein
MAKWLPMSTAPRDGSMIDAREKHTNHLNGFRTDRRAETWFSREERQWCRYLRGDIIHWNPTHWRSEAAQ